MSITSNLRSRWVWFTPLCDWSRKTRATLSTNHMQNENQSRLARRCFHAFSRALGSLLLFTLAIIGSSRYFPFFWLAVVITLVLVSRNSIQECSMLMVFLQTQPHQRKQRSVSCDKTVKKIIKMKAFLTLAIELGLALLSKRKVATLSWL